MIAIAAMIMSMFAACYALGWYVDRIICENRPWM